MMTKAVFDFNQALLHIIFTSNKKILLSSTKNSSISQNMQIYRRNGRCPQKSRIHLRWNWNPCFSIKFKRIAKLPLQNSLLNICIYFWWRILRKRLDRYYIVLLKKYCQIPNFSKATIQMSNENPTRYL